jgi:heterotetrameric sarcosine oxidase delta subunit
MKIPCPLCGPRDRREFYYYGSPDYLSPVAADADLDALDNQLFLRDNIAGQVADLWYHEAGCTSWIKVTRNTITHAVLGAELVMGAENAAPNAAQQSAPKAAPKPAAKPAAKPRKSPPKKDA